MEQALRERFIAFNKDVISLTDAKTGQARPITASSFDVVDAAFRRGGSHYKGKWQLTLSNGEVMRAFRGSMAQLQDWARREKLLDGQRNKGLDPVYVKMRNAVAHPRHHLVMPPDSARTIRGLAEIINRLWGHRTPGGRLYPAPLERLVQVVAWANSEHGLRHTILRAYLLPGFVGNPKAQAEGPGRASSCVPCMRTRAFWASTLGTRGPPCHQGTVWGPGTPEEALHAYGDQLAGPVQAG